MALRASTAQRAPAANRARTVSVRASAAPAHVATQQKTYYVAMNVFKVKPEHGAAFEEVWRQRESRLKDMPGFVRFAMLKCENVPGKYISQTYWDSKASFQNWASSPQFKASHGGSKGDGNGPAPGSARPTMGDMLEGHPVFEGFESVTTTE